MKFTGERMINHPESLLYQISFERYKFSGRFVKDKTVLDIACGSGYGSDYLAREAKYVFGADSAKEAIDFCKQEYSRKNIFFVQVERDGQTADFVNKFDVIVSFETIEHIQDYQNFLNNLKSYLRKGGTIIISTPNNFEKINPPENEYHVYEFDILELYNILKTLFYDCEISVFGQCKTDCRRYSACKKNPARKR